MKLYNFWRSSASYRVRIALHYKQLAFEYVAVDLLGTAAHLSDAYRAENPQLLIPLLVDGDIRVGQSLAILEYLEETHPERPLLPVLAADRARARYLAQFVASEIQAVNTLRIGRYLKDSVGVESDVIFDWRKHWISVGFDALESQLGESPFAVGEAPTIADMCLVPQVWYAQAMGVPTTRWRKLSAICDRCVALPAFAAAHPDIQVDAQKI